MNFPDSTKATKGGRTFEKQRTLFFGEVPEKSSRKDSQNTPLAWRCFRALKSEEIEIRFSNTTATEFGGYPLWDAFVEGLKLDGRLAHHIKMDRGANAFTAPELSRFLIDSRMLGASRLHHVDAMRYDPMLTAFFGIDGLPSDETIGRYLKPCEPRHLESLDSLSIRINEFGWKALRKAGCEAAGVEHMRESQEETGALGSVSARVVAVEKRLPADGCSKRPVAAMSCTCRASADPE